MKKYCLIIVCFLIISVFTGCGIDKNKSYDTNVLSVDSSNTNNQGTVSSAPINDVEEKKTIPSEINNLELNDKDFNIEYMDITINDRISFKQIADKLGIIIGEDNGNLEVKGGTSDYTWYVLHYPSKEKEDIQIEFLANETLKTETLLYVNLFNVKTNRGIGVGDDLEKLLLTYGDNVKPQYNSSSTDYYEYKLDQNNTDKIITVIVNKDSKKIEEISINYRLNLTMEELDIPSFD